MCGISSLQVPGVNLPISDIGYYVATLVICSVVHELGHAIAAVRYDFCSWYLRTQHEGYRLRMFETVMLKKVFGSKREEVMSSFQILIH